MLRIVVLISGNGSNLQAIIDACKQGLAVEIVAVVSDQADAYGLERAKLAHIPSHTVNAENTNELSVNIGQQLEYYQPDLVVLAGFMRRLSKTLVNQYAGRIINIHPSLLPKFPGLHTHQRALDAGETHHGVSIHFVTAKIDAGPIICQSALPVLTTDDAESLQQRIQNIEHKLYPQLLAWFAAGKIQLVANQIIFFDGKPLSTPISKDYS